MDINQTAEQLFWFALNVKTAEAHTNQATPAIVGAITFKQTHRLAFWETFQSGNDTYYSYKDIITNPPEKYELNGIAKQSKVGDKVTLAFNGTGYKTTTYTHSDGKKAETTYKVYSKMKGELCKNGNIKIILDEENGETSKAKIDGQEVDYNDLYSSESNFCLKKVK